jgi:hypothetical protein
MDLPSGTAEQWEAAFRKVEASYARNKSRRYVLLMVRDELKRLATMHTCAECGLRYEDGDHFYDDTCNPCARKTGLEVPK